MKRIKSVFGGHEVVLSDVKSKLKRTREEWNNYKKYNKNDLYNEKLLFPLITKLFRVPCTEFDAAINFINRTFSTDPAAAMDEIFELSQPVKLFLKDIFFLWRDFIEKQMISVLGHKPEFEDIDSSSPIIYFLAFDRQKYSSLRENFKTINYDYIGFCNAEVEKRLVNLLKFPINGLFKMMPDAAVEVCDKVQNIRLPEWDPPQELLYLKTVTCDDIIECVDHLVNYLETMDIWLEGREQYFIECAETFEKVAKIIKQELLAEN